MSTQERQTGFALPLVLWLMVVMIASIALLAFTATDHYRRSRTLADRTAGEAAALAGVYYALARMDAQMGSSRWYPDGQFHTLHFGGHDLTIKIRDESTKLDINQVDLSILDALMRLNGISADQADAISRGLIELRSAQATADTAFLAASRPLRAKFNSIDELLQLPRIAPQTFKVLAPYLTVQTGLVEPASSDTETMVRSALVLAGRKVESSVETQSVGSGIYDVTVDAVSSNGARSRLHVVLKSTSGYDGRHEVKWLVWEQGLWQQ